MLVGTDCPWEEIQSRVRQFLPLRPSPRELRAEGSLPAALTASGGTCSSFLKRNVSWTWLYIGTPWGSVEAPVVWLPPQTFWFNWSGVCPGPQGFRKLPRPSNNWESRLGRSEKVHHSACQRYSFVFRPLLYPFPCITSLCRAPYCFLSWEGLQEHLLHKAWIFIC